RHSLPPRCDRIFCRMRAGCSLFLFGFPEQKVPAAQEGWEIAQDQQLRELGEVRPLGFWPPSGCQRKHSSETCSPRRSLMPSDRPRRSRLTTEGIGRAPNRAMLRAVGFLDDDFSKPMIGVASLFSDITPCNAHLDRLARKAVEGIRAAGGVGQVFGAPTASDGIMMGHQGMRYSLVSREVIADSLELVAAGMNHDGLLAFGGCDKNMPGCLMGIARLNIPSVFVYGGSILPGTGPAGEDIDIVSIFEAVGRHQAGTLDSVGVHKIECEACPGPGSCGGMYTA